MKKPSIVANCIRFEDFKVVCEWAIFMFDATPSGKSEYLGEMAEILEDCESAEEAAEELVRNNNDGSWHVIKGLGTEIPSTSICA